MPARGLTWVAALTLSLVVSTLAGRGQDTNPSPQNSPLQTDPREGQEPLSPESQKDRPNISRQKPVNRATGTSEQEAWSLLEQAANSDKAGDRAAAVRALGLLPGNARAIKMAEAALKDDKPEVRTSAALALGTMHAEGSAPALRAMLDDPEPSVALAAGQALTTLHDASGYDVYYEVLTGERKTGKGLIASQESIFKDPKKLASMGIAEGVGFIPFGGFGWEAFKALTKDDVSPVRASAARMLATDPDPASRKALENATGDKSWLVRTAALEALAKRGDPAAIPTVELLIYDEKDIVRYTAAGGYLHLEQIRQERAAKKPKHKSREKTLRKK